jgi:hypothetical protein
VLVVLFVAGFTINAARGMTIDNGWKDVADVALNWLAAKAF